MHLKKKFLCCGEIMKEVFDEMLLQNLPLLYFEYECSTLFSPLIELEKKSFSTIHRSIFFHIRLGTRLNIERACN